MHDHFRNETGPCRVGGFTLVELLAVTGIIAMLIAILLPALQAARRAAGSAGCASNLRQVQTAMFAYAVDHQGTLPWAEVSYPTGSGADDVVLTWDDLLAPYLKVAATAEELNAPAFPREVNVMRCPADNVERYTRGVTRSLYPRSYAIVRAYGYNWERKVYFRGIAGTARTSGGVPWTQYRNHLSSKLSQLQREGALLTVIESPWWGNILGGPNGYADNPLSHWGGSYFAFVGQNYRTPHGKHWNYLFSDGHVEACPWEEQSELIYVSLPPLRKARPTTPPEIMRSNLIRLSVSVTQYQQEYVQFPFEPDPPPYEVVRPPTRDDNGVIGSWWSVMFGSERTFD